MTCQELIEYIIEKYQVEVSIIIGGNTTIIQKFMGNAKTRLNRKIEDIYSEYSKVKLREDTKYLNLELSGDIGDVTAIMHTSRYVFKN